MTFRIRGARSDDHGQLLTIWRAAVEASHALLFVAPSAQGSGVGSALLDDVADEYGELRLDVNEQNPLARAFYQSKGFEQVGRSELDTEGRPFPLLHLRRIRPLG